MHTKILGGGGGHAPASSRKYAPDGKWIFLPQDTLLLLKIHLISLSSTPTFTKMNKWQTHWLLVGFYFFSKVNFIITFYNCIVITTKPKILTYMHHMLKV